MIRDLQRAFRNFYRHRSTYSLLPVSREDDVAAGAAGGALAGGVGAISATGEEESSDGEAGAPIVESLLPPGPVAEVRFKPILLRIAPGGMRRVKASAVDTTGRMVEEPVEFSWEVVRNVGRVQAEQGGSAAVSVIAFHAADVCDAGALIARAVAACGSAEAELPVDVTEDLPDRGSNEGIPDPELIDAPGERSSPRGGSDGVMTSVDCFTSLIRAFDSA